MHKMTGSMARSLLRECPKCSEPVMPDTTDCGYCGQPIAPRKRAMIRVLEVASLAAVLVVIILVCRLLGQLLGI